MSISAVPPANGEYKGEITMDAIPKPARPFEGKLLDFNGDTVRPVKTTYMARLDRAGSEKVEVSRNTIWLCGTALVLLGVIFSYGSSMLGWIRADEGIRVNQSSMQKDMDEMRMESHLVVFVWLAISSAYVITGVGFTSIARKIHPYGWPLYILGAGYSFFGVFGIVTVVIALVRIYNGYNPAYGEIGYVGYVRLVTGTMFSCFVAGLTTVSVYRMANFDAAERQIVLEAAKTFAQLKRTVEEVRG